MFFILVQMVKHIIELLAVHIRNWQKFSYVAR